MTNTTSAKPLRVVVAGGGVAGLATAALLQRTGAHEVTVLEHAAEYGDAGYGLGLYPLGSAVFHALGRYDDLLARSVPLNSYRVCSPQGETLQEVDFVSLMTGIGPMLGVSRASLIEVLADCLQPGTVHFGQHAAAVVETAGALEVRTSAGATFDADIVVAADGMHSAVRKGLMGQVPEYDTGWDAWMWWAPERVCPTQGAVEFWAPSAFVGLYSVPQSTNVAVGIPRHLSPDAALPQPEVLAALRETVAERNPAAAALDGLWEVQRGALFPWRLADVRAPAITALSDRVALVGDAGIGFLPTAGVGASNALRSAAALAQELSLCDAESGALGVRRWAQRVRSLVERNQQESRRLAKLMVVEHKSTAAVVRTIMAHTPVTTIAKGISESMQAPF